MAITSKAFFVSAERLRLSAEESDQRACISRAYYSAYHEVKGVEKKLTRRSFATPSVGVHERLINAFDNLANPESVRQIGRQLRRLKRMRTVADYRLKVKVTPRDSDAAIECASDVRQRVHIAKQSISRSRMRNTAVTSD